MISGSALAAALALGGCDLAPPYVAPAMTLPQNFKELGPWTTAEPQDASMRGDWWAAFHDPTLEALERQIDQSNPSLQAALAAYDQSRAFAAQARSELSPTISGFDSNTYNRQSDKRPLRGANQPNEYAVNTFGAAFDYEIDFWGRVRNQVRAGEAEAQASAADLATSRLSLQASLADNYLALRGLDAQSKLLHGTVNAYQRALSLTQTRHAGGVSSGLDVDRASAQLSSAKAQISEITAQRAAFEHAIASLVGQPASSFSIPAADLPVSIPAIPVGVPSTLIQRRPDVAAAERRAFAANREIGVTRAAFFPTITLDNQGGFQNTGNQNLFIAPDTFWTVGPQLAMTLFDGGRRKAIVAASKSRFLQTSAQYRATVLSAIQEVEDQLSLSNDLAQEARDEADTVRAAQATTQLSLTRYREGATNYLDVVTAQTAELLAEQSALSLQTRRQQGSVDLVRALGGGWSATDLSRPLQAAKLDRGHAAKPATP